MTPFDAFIQFLARLIPVFSIWWIIKLFFVVGLLLYNFFAVIVLRQVVLMSKTLVGEGGDILRLISWVHLIAAIVVFFLALVIL